MAFVGSLSGSGGASNTINVTGSMIIANPGTGGTFPAFPGTDTVFFVSGAIDGKTAGSRTVSVFGGDVVASGSITVGTGSITIDSNEIRFQGGAAKITSGSGGLTFFDSGNSGGVTLTSLSAGAGGGDVDGPASATDNAIARFDQTTGKIIQNSAVTISDESANVVSIAGSATATTINLFNTDATTVNLAQAATIITAGASGGSTTFQGNLTGSNVLASALTVTNGATFGGGFGSTGVSISGAGDISADGSVIVGGDLTVNGTTTTINTTNLLVEDPIIYFGSGSVGTNRNGGIALASGSSVTDQALVWGRVANDTWGAGRLDVTNGTVTDLTTMSLLPVRASKFELGGATAFVTSSDGTNIAITHGSTSTTTFTKAGTPIVQVGDYAGSGEGQIKGVTTANALSALWLSGSEINVGATSVSFLVNDVPQAKITPLASGGGVRFEGQDGTGAPRAMVISGSQTTIGTNSGLVVFEGAGTPYLTASAGGGSVSLTAGAGLATANVFNTVSTTVNLAQAATTINMGNVAGTNNVAGATKFTQGLSGSLTKLTDGSSYLIAGTNISIATGSNGAVTISTSGVGDVSGPGSSTDTAIARFNGLTGKIIQNTAGVTINASNNVVTSGSFSVKDGAGIEVAAIRNTGAITGSNALLTGNLSVNGTGINTISTTFNFVDTTATTLNLARGATTLTAGAPGGSTTFQGNLTGSNVLASTLTVTNGATFGGGFGSTGLTINPLGNVATNGTLLVEGATTLSGSVILGDATGDDLTFNGYAASSLVPKTTNLYDLGTPDLRWRNMYTGDLHLKNERGDWTVIEEEDFLTLTNNKSGKRYKFVLEEI
jgi:hypothetical protein